MGDSVFVTPRAVSLGGYFLLCADGQTLVPCDRPVFSSGFIEENGADGAKMRIIRLDLRFFFEMDKS